MSLSSRIKRHVRRNVHESRQARERREAQAWRQRWDGGWGWLRRHAAYSMYRREVMQAHGEALVRGLQTGIIDPKLQAMGVSGPVTVHFSLDTGRHFRVA